MKKKLSLLIPAAVLGIANVMQAAPVDLTAVAADGPGSITAGVGTATPIYAMLVSVTLGLVILKKFGVRR